VFIGAQRNRSVPDIPFWARLFLWTHQVIFGFPNTKLVHLGRRCLSATATLMCVPPCASFTQQLLNSFIVRTTAKPNAFHNSTSLEDFRGFLHDLYRHARKHRRGVACIFTKSIQIWSSRSNTCRVSCSEATQSL